MRFLRQFFLCIIIFLIFCGITEKDVFAMTTGFSTKKLPEAEQESILSKDKDIFYNEPASAPIVCFDVNENGSFLVVYKGASDRRVGIYDPQGNFQYGYSLGPGGNLGAEWDEENIILYFMRGDLALLVDPYGNCLEACEISLTNPKNKLYWNQVVFSTEKDCGKKKYILTSSLGPLNGLFHSYSKITCMSDDGKETVLYNVDKAVFLKILSMLVFVAIFIIIIVVVLLKTLKHLPKFFQFIKR